MNQGILENPPTEAEIIGRWNPERGPLVSVCMLAFNHAPFIRNALNSILNQKTDFGFEILVHDDASQDGTANILREYSRRYPAIVKPILQTVNQYSQGIYPSVHFNYPRANLPFVAMCEGDDHWTDELKLQLQVDGLLVRPELNLSFHQAIRVHCSEPDAPTKIIGDYGLSDGVVPFNDIIFRIRGWIPFASCMIRQRAKERFLNFIQSRPYLTVGDLYFQLFGSEPAGALYIARPMSLYRFASTNSWTHNVIANIDRKIRHEKAMVRSYFELDKLLEGQYHEKFTSLILQRLIWIFNPARLDPMITPLLSDQISLPDEVITQYKLEALIIPYRQCQAKIKEQLKTWKSSGKRYVIFGCASGCEIILSTIDTNQVSAIIDRDNRIVGQFKYGIPVISPEQLGLFPDIELLVSTFSAERESINSLAKSAGLMPCNIHYLFDSAIQHLDSHPIFTHALN